MTTLQVAYQQALEQERHNREMERETARSNVARENETARSNVARETETNRANVAQESLKGSENATKWVDSVNKVLTGGKGIFGTLTDVGKAIAGIAGIM